MESLQFMLSKLYTITHKEEEFFKLKFSDENHPVFQAHFPNNPILPGFIMLEICAEVLDHEICEIKKVKFITQVKPKDELLFLIRARENSLHVEVKKDEVKVAVLIYEKI